MSIPTSQLLRAVLVTVPLLAACGPDVAVDPPPPPGNGTTDGGSGAGAADSGWDAGQLGADAGGAGVDGGDLEEDGGWSEADAGVDESDGGVDEADAGVEQPDGGSSSDAGVTPVCPTTAPAAPVYTGVNNDPRFLQVYNNNIENLEVPTNQCPGDWQDLFYYMKQNPSPDVFLVQQLSGQVQLDFLVQYMTNNLPGSYAGIIAEANPDAMNSPCGPPKDYQTNAIIYRTGRLTPIGSKHVWQSYAKLNDVCKRNFQARTRNVMQKFRDTVAHKDVTVASLHWSTFSGTAPDPACAELNVREAAQKVQSAGFGGDLVLFGGDTNEPDLNSSNAYKPWYREINGDLGGGLGFRDPIFDKCRTTSAVKTCLTDNASMGSGNRIDFVFTRMGNGCRPITSRQHTISWAEADAAALQLSGSDDPANYSDHRASRAAIHY